MLLSPPSFSAGAEALRVDTQIRYLSKLEQSEQADSDIYFELGTLYWAKRDFTNRNFDKNDLAKKASDYFARYAQTDKESASKSIALFCVDRIRQARQLGIQAGEDFVACSNMISRHITGDGQSPEDQLIHSEISEAMTGEVLYDIAYRFTDWDYLALERLGSALIASDLVTVDEVSLNDALIKNAQTRLGFNYTRNSEPAEKRDFNEVFNIAWSLQNKGLDEANLTQLDRLLREAFKIREMEAGLGCALVAEADSLIKEVKAQLIVYHLEHDDLPTSLDETAFLSHQLPGFVEMVSFDGTDISVSFGPHLLVPPALESATHVHEVTIVDDMLTDHCSERSTVNKRFLPPKHNCA